MSPSDRPSGAHTGNLPARDLSTRAVRLALEQIDAERLLPGVELGGGYGGGIVECGTQTPGLAAYVAVAEIGAATDQRAAWERRCCWSRARPGGLASVICTAGRGARLLQHKACRVSDELGSPLFERHRARPSPGRQARRLGRLRPSRGALPRRVARPLLSHARLGPGCRGRAPRVAAAGLARACSI